jgi:hypothetical protein
MVKSGKIVAIIAIASLFLSCQFFFASIFSDDLMFIDASTDLSGTINRIIGEEPPDDYEYKLFLLQDPGGRELLFLVVYPKYTWEGQVMIFDVELNQLAQLGGQVEGLCLVDSQQFFVVGDMRIDATTLEQVSSAPGGLWMPGFSIPGGDNYLAYVDNGYDPPELVTDVYDMAWLDVSPPPPPPPSVAPVPHEGYKLRKISYDRDRTGQEVGLFFTNDFENKTEVLFLGEALFPLTGSYPFGAVPVVFERHVSWETIHYTRQGMVVSHDNWHELFDFSNGERVGAAFMGKRGPREYAYTIEGNTFYAYDRSEHRLYKYNTWW